MSSWWFIAAVVLVVAAVALIVIARKRNVTAAGSARPLVLLLGRIVAIAYAAITLLSATATVILTMTSDFVRVSLPVQEFWPDAYPWIVLTPHPAATVVGGGFTRADVTVSGLGADARLLLAGGHALVGITIVVIAVVIALLFHRLLGGSPFRPVLARSVMFSAVTIAVGGIAWQLCFELAGSVASAQVLGVTGWNSEFPTVEVSDFIDSTLDALATGLPQPALGWSVDFWPLFVGLALAAVAIAFRYSERLQRDTEGLV